jgi:hypothetical protein
VGLLKQETMIGERGKEEFKRKLEEGGDLQASKIRTTWETFRNSEFQAPT